MKTLIKTDIHYFISSRCLLGILFFWTLFNVINVGSNYFSVRDNLTRYNAACEFVTEHGGSVDEQLAEGYEINEYGSVRNPLSFSMELLTAAVQTASPERSISQFLEGCTLIVPVIASIIGMILVSYDEKNRTVKMKVTRSGKNNYIISKQLSGMIIILLSAVVSLVIDVIVNVIVYRQINKDFDLSFITVTSPEKENLFMQVIYIAVMSFFFFETGYIFSSLFRCYFAVPLAVSIYTLFVPALFKYDLNNVRSIIEKKLFLFNGMVHAGKTISSSLPAGIAVVTGALMLAALCNYFISLKKSAFI